AAGIWAHLQRTPQRKSMSAPCNISNVPNGPLHDRLAGGLWPAVFGQISNVDGAHKFESPQFLCWRLSSILLFDFSNFGSVDKTLGCTGSFPGSTRSSARNHSI